MKRTWIRRVTKPMALGLAALALVAQLFSGFNLPGDSSKASATQFDRFNKDNIVYGGIKDKDHMLHVYDSYSDIRAIYEHYGITRADIASMTMGSFNTSDFGGQLKTLGRVNYNVPNRYAVNIPGAGQVYTGGYLNGANNKNAGYPLQALIGKRSADGKWFAIVLFCGNLTYVEDLPPKPQPPKPQPKPAAACKAIDVQKTARDAARLTATATVENGAKITGYHFDVVNKAGQHVVSKDVAGTGTTATLDINGLAADSYTVRAIVKTTLGDITSENCRGHFTVTPAPVKNITVCDLKTNTVVTIKESEFDKTKHSTNFDDCKQIRVCDITTGQAVTIKKSENDAKRYTSDFSKCEKVDACEIATKATKTVTKDQIDEKTYTQDKTKCEQPTPSVTITKTPTELPRTGIAAGLPMFLGAGALTSGLVYLLAGRRK